ncbi:MULTISPECIES: hypothetical protein [Bacillus]|uniref:hypothetical protein n=1 Tax=Bacillus TaxID=1386 RepID=UPI000497F36E|nr:hypothetical protein [Bacillus sonorensis]MBG9914725.1 hypothetical protein [Bacillus sonorensis]MCF7615975.1 hypothetical protein [Bacillus sonorensis]MCY7858097.1 hypothetical protein [Bacillus sonorensis]MCY8024005.1 hypothetical protein [Bacillus sonorensis]MCY8033167.1 hypothetical protein [Bacillus sonorensis]
MFKRILASAAISFLILILIGIGSFILYAILSFFFLQSFATGNLSQDEALGWGYIGMLVISFILAILTSGIAGVVSFCKYFKKYGEKNRSI